MTFKEFVQEHQKKSKMTIIGENDFMKLFSHLNELILLNKSLLTDFEQRIDFEHWQTNPKIADVIVRKGPFLKIYSTYITKYSLLNDHLDHCCKKYPKFSKLIKEFESTEHCHNLKLKHFFLKPVQRLPQYKLLLQVILTKVNRVVYYNA